MPSCSDPTTVGQKGGRPRLDIPKVLEERTMWEPMSGCRLWLGPWDGLYGTIGQKKAHRVAYEHIKGPIPEGLVLDHLCRVTICINPNHLEPVTDLMNIRRGMGNASKTHCPQGHPYDGENQLFCVAKMGIYSDEHVEHAGKKDAPANDAMISGHTVPTAILLQVII